MSKSNVGVAMFAFLKSKPAPEGPVQFEVAIEVERPASEVYPLIDWADPRNAKRQLGHNVETLGGGSGRFRLTLTEMPEHRFDMDVIEIVPGAKYAFSTDIVPRVGRLESSEEHYSFEPTGENRCMLRLVTVATFRKGLSMKQFEQELVMMTLACQRAVTKLKVHAESGVDAVQAFDLCV